MSLPACDPAGLRHPAALPGPGGLPVRRRPEGRPPPGAGCRWTSPCSPARCSPGSWPCASCAGPGCAPRAARPWWASGSSASCPGLFRAADSPYGLQKVATIYTFTLLAALAPLLLVEDRRRPARLVNALACFCLVITLGGLLGAAAGRPAPAPPSGAAPFARGGPPASCSPSRPSPWRSGPVPGLTFGITGAGRGHRGFLGFPGARSWPGLAALALLFGAGRSAWAAGPLRLAAAGGRLLALGSSLSLAPQGLPGPGGGLLPAATTGHSEAYRVNALRASWGLRGGRPLGHRLGRLRRPGGPGAGRGPAVSPQPPGRGHPGIRLGLRRGHPPGAGRRPWPRAGPAPAGLGAGWCSPGTVLLPRSTPWSAAT